MHKEFEEQLAGLLEKYTELLTGEATEENQEKVRTWIIYNHISKTMPALARHWNELYPDGKENIKQIILEVKKLNETNRTNQDRSEK